MSWKNPVLLLIVLSFFCINTRGNGINKDEADSLRYEMVELENECPPEDSFITRAVIRVEYPKITEAPHPYVMDSINNFIKNYLLSQFGDRTGQGSLEKQLDQFITEFKKFRVNFPKVLGWFDEKKVSVINDTLGILSLKYFYYFYTGGAHPNSTVKYFNFDINTGCILTLKDLFIPGFETELNKIAEKEFRKEKKLSPDEDLEKAGFQFEDNQFKVNDNFAVTTEGLKFHFNDYEIASYSRGPTRLEISYEALRRIIDINGPLKNFVK